MAGNRIDDECVKVLSKALEGNDCLETLSLEGSPDMKIHDVGAVALSKMLKINNSLTKLDLICEP